MKALFRFFAHRPALASVFTGMTLLLGLSSLAQIQRDNFPNVDFQELTVTTRYPGADPRDVERNVTNEIEDALKALDGIDQVLSHSMDNVSIVQVRIDADTRDTRAVKSKVRDAVANVSGLPPEVDGAPVVEEVTTATGSPIIEIGLSGDRSYADLRELARSLEREIRRLPGIAKVVKQGYLEREVRVQLSADAIAKWNIPMRQVVDAIRNHNVRATAGSLGSYTDDMNIVTLARFADLEAVAGVVVHKTERGMLVHLEDVADLVDDFERPKVLNRMNGNPAITFQVYKKESADILRTVDAISDFIDARRATLPDNVQLDTSANASRLVRSRLGVVASNGVMGLALVLLLLWLCLDLRSAMWVATSIPVVLLGTLAMLPLFGAYLDSITLAAMILVIGIVVDDGIVVAESIWRHRELGLAPLRAAVEGMAAVFKPVLTTIATTALAFAPMFFMSGTLGAFVYVIPLVVVLALTVSLAELTIALPAHLVNGVADVRKRVGRLDRQIAWLSDGIVRLASHALRHRAVVVVVFSMVLLGSLGYVARYMQFTLFPTQSANGFYMLVEFPGGSSLRHSNDDVRALELLLEGLPEGELDSYVTRVGTHDGFNPGENASWAALGVYLSPHAERDRNADQIVEGLRASAAQIPGIAKLTFVVDSGGPGVGSPISIRVTGNDDWARAEATAELRRRLQAITGVKDIDSDDKPGKAQVSIELDYVRLANAGLSVTDVAREVRLAYAGEIVTSVRRGDEDVEFRVALADQFRNSVTDLGRLMVANRAGDFIRLDEVARFQVEAGPLTIHHVDFERSTSITADVTKDISTPTEVLEQVFAGLEHGRTWPGLTLSVDGETATTDRSMNSLVFAFALAAIGIYLALLLLFNSASQPLVVMAAIPFSLPGVFLALATHQMSIGFLAMLGIIGLSGVVVNNSLILVHTVNSLQQGQPASPRAAVILEAVRMRVRPILLTSVTTVAGLLPMAYGFGGSDAFSAPMAFTIGYGVLFAAPMTLIVLPSVLLVVEDIAAFARMVQPRSLVRRRIGRRLIRPPSSCA